MIFLRYESLRQYLRSYPVTSLLLFANVIMFLILIAAGGPDNIQVLIRYGAITNDPGYDQVWRNIAALFLHLSWSHIIFNMFAIFVFAPPLEQIFGHVRYLFFYLLSGVLGNAIALVMAPSSEFWLGVGASTSIYGLYGAYLFIALFQRQALDQGSRSTIFGILAMGLIYSFVVPNIGYWAHIGGLAAGFVIYAIMGRKLLSR